LLQGSTVNNIRNSHVPEATHLLAPVLQDFHHQHFQTLSNFSPTMMSLLFTNSLEKPWKSPHLHLKEVSSMTEQALLASLKTVPETCQTGIK
jgi:hypothetical protein